MLLEGLHIPLTTPFHPDGRLNPHKLAANVIRYSKSPASGLIALAPQTGEPTLLTDEETREVLRTVAEAAAPEKVLLANTSRDSVHATLALAGDAAQLAFDAILVGPPTFLRSSSNSGDGFRQLQLFFQATADRSPVPLVLVSTDEQTFSHALLAELAAHPNILGMLNIASSIPTDVLRSQAAAVHRDVTVTSTFGPVTGRMLRASAATAHLTHPTLIPAASLARNPAAAATSVAQPRPSVPALRTRIKSVGFQFISADYGTALESLNSGASAIAPAFAACAPQACYEVFAAWKDADQPLAFEKQQRIVQPALYAETLGPGGLKFGCDLNGYFGGRARLPHLSPGLRPAHKASATHGRDPHVSRPDRTAGPVQEPPLHHGGLGRRMQLLQHEYTQRTAL